MKTRFFLFFSLFIAFFSPVFSADKLTPEAFSGKVVLVSFDITQTLLDGEIQSLLFWGVMENLESLKPEEKIICKFKRENFLYEAIVSPGLIDTKNNKVLSLGFSAFQLTFRGATSMFFVDLNSLDDSPSNYAHTAEPHAISFQIVDNSNLDFHIKIANKYRKYAKRESIPCKTVKRKQPTTTITIE